MFGAVLFLIQSRHIVSYVLVTVNDVFSSAVFPVKDMVVLSNGNVSMYSSFSGGLCWKIIAASALARFTDPTSPYVKQSSFPCFTCLRHSLYFSCFATRLCTSSDSPI